MSTHSENSSKRKRNLIFIAIAAVIAIVAIILVVTKVIIPNNNFKAKMELLQTASVGDTVCFGTYEQDNDTSNGAEAIEWQVLAKENGKLLVISKYALDCQPYNTSFNAVTWETCTLRTWLNEDFLNSAFNTKEQAAIAQTTVTADKNPEYDTDPGDDTTDKVFLLSINEAEKYFSAGSARQCRPTDYAIANGARVGSVNYGGYVCDGTCFWWLRTPGNIQTHAADVNIIGYTRGFDKVDNSEFAAVRPAMWIDLDA